MAISILSSAAMVTIAMVQRRGKAWLFENTDGRVNFVQNPQPILNIGGDIDFGAVLDIDKDGMDDLVMGNGDADGVYIQNVATPTSVYALQSDAISTELAGLNPLDERAIVSVSITSVSLSDVDANNTITFYVSNNDGRDWELVKTNELPAPLGAGDPHAFVHFGDELRWKAVLTSNADPLTGADVLFAPASEDTPKLTNLVLSYKFVEKARYSRSGFAFGTVDILGNPTDLLFGADFMFPGFESRVRALDQTALPAGSPGCTSRRVDDSNAAVSEVWGDNDSDHFPGPRTIYAAYEADGDGKVNDRINVSTDPITGSSPVPLLASLMNIAALPDAERTSLRDFILGGFGDVNKKLRHVEHSTPIFIAEPLGPDDLGPGYAAFKAAQASRDPMVYVGSNGGMLHAFYADSGVERWGFVPRNLLAKLKEQRNSDDEYEHQNMVDGPLILRDIYDSEGVIAPAGNEWHTVLISGQGRGAGADSNNYFFAIDVTDPGDPKPLWEFTDSGVSLGATCSGDPTSDVCTQDCTSTTCNNSCSQVQHMFQEQPSGGNVVVAMEAENFNTNFTVANPNVIPTEQHAWTTVVDGTRSNGNYMHVLPDGVTDTATSTPGMNGIASMIAVNAARR
ncbi:MAG: PilC/PilY family type IV pilus protein [Myxococcota bacterium]